MRSVSKLACLMMIAAGSAMAVPQQGANSDELPRATSQLLAQYPGIEVLHENGGICSIYGKPMSEGATAELAAANFIAMHKDALGVPNLELRLDNVEEVDYGRFRVFTYKQTIGGVDVEFGFMRVLVLVNRPNGGQPAVVHVGAKLAQGSNSDIKMDTVSAQQAVGFVQSIADWKSLPVWSAPEMVVFYGDGDLPTTIKPIRAWKFTGEQPIIGDHGNSRKKYTFFVDAAGTGLKAVRDEVCTVDVTGNVQVWATPGTAADHAGNPPVLMNFPWFKVGIGTSPTAFTNASGNFVLTNSGSTNVTVQTSVDSSYGGKWTYIASITGVGTIQTASTSVTPPGPANLVLNVGPTEYNTSQANVIMAADYAHDFIKDRAPTFTALDARLPSNVNLNDTCNAYYDGASINFFRSGGGCNNTGFSTVAAHEYGHHIVNRRSLAQNSFGEGFGDCIGMLGYNDPVLGRFFQTSGGAVRTPDTANIPVPCTGTQEIHNCGQQLPGVWWEIKKAFDTKYGTTVGLARTQQLFVNWYLITTGGISTYQAIGTSTATEVMTVNDTDGDITNGTPDYTEIKNSFCMHNVSSPVLNLATISFPSPLPATLNPSAGTPVDWVVTNGNATYTATTARLFYRPAGTTFYFSAPTAETSPLHFTSTIPAISCGTTIEYYFQIGTSNGNVVMPTTTCAGSVLYTATSQFGTTNIWSDDFETNRGWTYGAAGDTAGTGQWERGAPQATSAQPGSDHTTGAGTMCAVTGATANRGTTTGDGANDVDGGFTTLISPAIDLSGRSNVYLSYWRWYDNSRGGAPGADTFRSYISNDNGTTWTLFETVGPSTQNTGGWVNKNARIDISGLPSMTSQMKFRFVAEDAGTGSLVEALVDDFLVYTLDCTPPCAADFNGDGTLDFFDYLDFVDAFSANLASADFNHDSVIDFFDYLDFVDAFSTGC